MIVKHNPERSSVIFKWHSRRLVWLLFLKWHQIAREIRNSFWQKIRDETKTFGKLDQNRRRIKFLWKGINKKRLRHPELKEGSHTEYQRRAIILSVWSGCQVKQERPTSHFVNVFASVIAEYQKDHQTGLSSRFFIGPSPNSHHLQLVTQPEGGIGVRMAGCWWWALCLIENKAFKAACRGGHCVFLCFHLIYLDIFIWYLPVSSLVPPSSYLMLRMIFLTMKFVRDPFLFSLIFYYSFFFTSFVAPPAVSPAHDW